MRDLIRPTLFMLARLGLFLSIVLWVLAQWWHVFVGGSCFGFGGLFQTDETVCSASILRYGPLDWTVGVVPVGKMEFELEAWLDEDNRQWLASEEGATIYSPVSGLVVLSYPPSSFSVVTQYWIPIAIMAMLNLFLHWLYRKPRQELAA